MIRGTGLAPWEFEFPFPGSLTSTFLEQAGDFLIGADGINSVVRKYLFLRTVCQLVGGKIDWGIVNLVRPPN